MKNFNLQYWITVRHVLPELGDIHVDICRGNQLRIILMIKSGNVIWDITRKMLHCYLIEHVPNKLIII